jgi:hypothetical protein
MGSLILKAYHFCGLVAVYVPAQAGADASGDSAASLSSRIASAE